MATCPDWELMSCLSAPRRTAGKCKRVVEPAGLKIVGIFKHPQGIGSLIEAELAWLKGVEGLLCIVLDIWAAIDEDKSRPLPDQSLKAFTFSRF
jgi:hypothetical protein